jgi:hypothetical protein
VAQLRAGELTWPRRRASTSADPSG